jgi:hypothetical protein
VRLSPLGTAATTGLLYQPQMIDEGDCGAIGGMKIGRGNRSTRRKPAPAPLWPPQIWHDHGRARTGSQRLTVWAVVRKVLCTRRIGRADLCRAVVWWTDSCWKIAWNKRFIAGCCLRGLTTSQIREWFGTALGASIRVDTGQWGRDPREASSSFTCYISWRCFQHVSPFGPCLSLGLQLMFTQLSVYSRSAARSNTGIVGSNPTQGMDVCVRLFCFCVALCVGSDFATGWSPVQRSPTDCV